MKPNIKTVLFLTVLHLLHYYQWDIFKKKKPYILICSTEIVFVSMNLTNLTL